MTESKLDFWIKNNLNVLFTGKHGVGKTTIILDAFKRNNLKWLYFSGSTLDPWVDFVGVPKEVTDTASGKSYLDLIRPKHFAEDEVEAIFIDEYNRSKEKIRNATMELIQFKSINGKKFKNLKLVWAAINPSDDMDSNSTYDVDKIDPAQKDRFEIQVEIPYKVNLNFFQKKYGEADAKAAVSWWNDLPQEHKDSVSPRRLDYILNLYQLGGDIRDVLPPSTKINVTKLISELKSGGSLKILKAIFDARNSIEAKTFLTDQNNYNAVIKHIIASKEFMDFFFEFIPEELQCNLICTSDPCAKFAIIHEYKYKKILDSLCKKNEKLNQARIKYNRSKPIDALTYEKFTFSSPALAFSTRPKDYATHYTNFLDACKLEAENIAVNTAYRKNLYKLIIHEMYFNRGYNFPDNRNANYKPFTAKECQSVLEYLNSIISQTTQYDNYPDLENIYGLICRDYLRIHGTKQDYSALSKSVQGYINSNSSLYL